MPVVRPGAQDQAGAGWAGDGTQTQEESDVSYACLDQSEDRIKRKHRLPKRLRKPKLRYINIRSCHTGRWSGKS